MDIKGILQIYVSSVKTVLVLLGLIQHGSSALDCPMGDLLQIENICNPFLGEIGTAILASDGFDFNTMCQAFDRYVLCMEPAIGHCEPSLFYRYWTNKLTYSGEPYHCKPALPTLYSKSQIEDRVGYVNNTDHRTPPAESAGVVSNGQWLLVTSAGMVGYLATLYRART